jgi:hypothetical protein
LQGIHDPKVRVWAVWEPVLATDRGAPSTATLARLRDSRAAQFWDQGRLLSKMMGEKDGKSVVWDHIAIYEAGTLWQDSVPKPVFAGRTVVRVIAQAEEKLRQLCAKI